LAAVVVVFVADVPGVVDLVAVVVVDLVVVVVVAVVLVVVVLEFFGFGGELKYPEAKCRKEQPQQIIGTPLAQTMTTSSEVRRQMNTQVQQVWT
jgi:hypothetical protein